MGTINYRTSKYITLGIYPECSWDYEKDPATMEELREYAEENGTTIEEEIDNSIKLNEEADYDNASWILDKYSFNNYTVQIEPGYYQGFSIDIREELPPFSWSEDLEVSIYEDHFSYTQKSLPGAIRNKLLDRAWAGEVHALNEEVW